MPWPSEIVPGDSRIRSPTTWTIGVWMAVMRDDVLSVRDVAAMKIARIIIVARFWRPQMLTRRTFVPAVALAIVTTLGATAAGPLQSPDQFLGHRVGADNKLARWDKIVEYMKLAAAASDRVRFRELGK